MNLYCQYPLREIDRKLYILKRAFMGTFFTYFDVPNLSMELRGHTTYITLAVGIVQDCLGE